MGVIPCGTAYLQYMRIFRDSAKICIMQQSTLINQPIVQCQHVCQTLSSCLRNSTSPSATDDSALQTYVPKFKLKRLSYSYASPSLFISTVQKASFQKEHATPDLGTTLLAECCLTNRSDLRTMNLRHLV